ncbi:BsuBI/PstI family type II restriction endonuclease [[Clostridium] polysaccharolyticum]|uniref:BsuBI/PstI restriction endonuclease C-terminus n=1 Tax=[Clostridium] polysaccharolyticum TaxID=29364 RepID=A0A1H9ZSQ4_9FIRM|nr:BsuBI/PstI family type II restriction endonuclease [[Clostridium] polysaccharolyticum]SES84758.1 BsuBI/PstI restriction endonuclease C-terminus [[Clostridium] polysaccharolyticum]
MSKKNEVKKFLQDVGMPEKQQSDVCCFVILALANIGKGDSWSKASNYWMKIHDIIQFTNEYYEKDYKENSRETFRKSALHHFRTAALVEDNGKATNSPNFMYRLTKEAVNLLRNLDTIEYDVCLNDFLEHYESLVEIYSSKKKLKKMPVKINGDEYEFSPGEHNELQKAILEEFAPRFAPDSECIYVGDTIKKDMVKNLNKLKKLGFEITLHDKMPDVVLYRKDKNWIYFVEAVTSAGPIDAKRIIEIEQMTKEVIAGKIYVTAFGDFRTYKKFSEDLAWETEVWIAENPDHMIHLNGDRFMGPR